VFQAEGAVVIAADPVRPGFLYVSTSGGLYGLAGGSATLLDRQGLSPTGLAVAPDGSRIYGITANQELAMLLPGSSVPTPRTVSYRQ
jgi:hypothetical protein